MDILKTYFQRSIKLWYSNKGKIVVGIICFVVFGTLGLSIYFCYPWKENEKLVRNNSTYRGMQNISLENTNLNEFKELVSTTSSPVSTADRYPSVQHEHEEDKGLPKDQIGRSMQNIYRDSTATPNELSIFEIITRSSVSTGNPHPSVQHEHEEDKGLPKDQIGRSMQNIYCDSTATPNELSIFEIITRSSVSTGNPHPSVQHEHEEDKGLPKDQIGRSMQNIYRDSTATPNELSIFKIITRSSVSTGNPHPSVQHEHEEDKG